MGSRRAGGGAMFAYDTCDSTMERAHALVREGAREGALVFAARQTQGRGRLGRKWESPEGGAYFSLILRPTCPPAEAPQLSLVAGLAAAETIHEQLTAMAAGPGSQSGSRHRLAGPTEARRRSADFLVRPASGGTPWPLEHQTCRSLTASPAAAIAVVSIRWPNDILLDGKKVAGILTEARDGAVVLGIGINVTTDPKNLPGTATSLEKMVPGSERTRGAWHLFSLVAAVCTKFDGWYDLWTAQGFAPIRAALRPLLNLGALVRLTTGTSQIEGQVTEVDEQGRLLVRLESGVTQPFEAGEVTLLR